MSKPINSVAISPSGNRAVALVDHDHVYCFDLSAHSDLKDADCWVVPRPAQTGNRVRKIRDSAILFSSESQVCLCHAAAWGADPRNQINLQQLDLRTGEILLECNIASRISNQCTPILLSDDLLLVGLDEDAVVVQLSSSQCVGALREMLWDSKIWKRSDDKPFEDDAMPRQGLVYDSRTGAVHALFDAYDKAFVESYRWSNRDCNFQCVKRQTIRECEVGALCVGPTGTLGVWMTNRGERIPIPPGGVEAISSAELGRMFFLGSRNRRRVEVRSGEDDDFTMMIMESVPAAEPDLLCIGTGPQPAFPFFCEESSVVVNTPAGRLVRIDEMGGSEELHRCNGRVTACAWSPQRGHLLIGTGSGGLTFLELPPIKGAAAVRSRRSTPKVSAKQIAERKRVKPRNVRLAETAIRKSLKEGGKVLFLEGHELTELPEALFEMHDLEALNLGYNRLQTLPAQLCGFRKLKYLNVCGNVLASLPESFGCLNQLQTLHLLGNPLKKLPDSFTELKHLKLLRMEELPLRTVPAQLRGLKKLRELNLSHTGIKELPEWIGELKELRELTVYRNSISSLPRSLAELPRLQLLDLSENRLETLPDWISDLGSLRILDLACNRLRTLPKSLVRMPKLSELCLLKNKMQALPEWLQDARIQKRLGLEC